MVKAASAMLRRISSSASLLQRQPHGPGRRQLRKPHAGQCQQARKDGQEGNAQRQHVQRRRHREGALEDAEREGLDGRLVDHVLRRKGEGIPEFACEACRLLRRDPHRIAQPVHIRIKLRQQIRVHHDLALGIAIIREDADHGQASPALERHHVVRSPSGTRRASCSLARTPLPAAMMSQAPGAASSMGQWSR